MISYEQHKNLYAPVPSFLFPRVVIKVRYRIDKLCQCILSTFLTRLLSPNHTLLRAISDPQLETSAKCIYNMSCKSYTGGMMYVLDLPIKNLLKYTPGMLETITTRRYTKVIARLTRATIINMPGLTCSSAWISLWCHWFHWRIWSDRQN